MLVSALALLAVAHQSSPSDAFRKFIAAWNKHDLAAMAALTVNGNAQYGKDFPTKGWPTLDIDSVKERVTGDIAKVTATLSVRSAAQTKPNSHAEVDMLKRINNRWLLLPDKNSNGMGAVAYMLSHKGSLGFALGSAQKVACLSNVKQIVTGFLMFANDHDDKLPTAAASSQQAVAPYLRNADLWKCPQTNRPAYAMNDKLAGHSLASIKLPAQTVMVYEGSNGKLDFRHDGAAAVGFCDGHAKMISRAGLAALRWKP